MTKLVSLASWASATFEDPPCQETLRRWARGGKLEPAAVKHGREYLVPLHARYVDRLSMSDVKLSSAPSLAQRMFGGTPPL